MKVSRKSEYAVRALIQMAHAARNGSVWQQISHIAKSTQIPEKFLEQILLDLKNSGFLKSRRGIAGGYSLNRSEQQINLEEVLFALDGTAFHSNSHQPVDTEASAVFSEAISEAEAACCIELRRKKLSILVNNFQAKCADQTAPSEYEI